HFSRSMKLALLPGNFDSFAQRRAGVFDSVELHQKLRTTEKRMDMRRLIGHEAAQQNKAFVTALFVVVFRRQTVAEELVLRLIPEHHFDLFAARGHHNLGLWTLD